MLDGRALRLHGLQVRSSILQSDKCRRARDLSTSGAPYMVTPASFSSLLYTPFNRAISLAWRVMSAQRFQRCEMDANIPVAGGAASAQHRRGLITAWSCQVHGLSSTRPPLFSDVCAGTMCNNTLCSIAWAAAYLLGHQRFYVELGLVDIPAEAHCVPVLLRERRRVPHELLRHAAANDAPTDSTQEPFVAGWCRSNLQHTQDACTLFMSLMLPASSAAIAVTLSNNGAGDWNWQGYSSAYVPPAPPCLSSETNANGSSTMATFAP